MNYFVLLFVAAVAICLALFDAILDRQHRAHPDAWRRDGCPWGFFSFAREVDFLPGCRARGTIFRQWLFHNPQWASTDSLARLYLVLFRVTGIAGVVLWSIGALRMLRVL
jgi:hypothetical protein